MGYLSAQGYDLCFGVNYLSHVLLSEKLIPLLEKSKLNPRIIQTSSTNHWLMDTSELVPSKNMDNDELSPIASRNEHNKPLPRAYPNSKLAQILHARHLSRKLLEKNNSSIIKVLSVSP